MESEAISIDKYLDSDVSQRFEFLYENYSVLKAIIKDYREDIINDVIDMKSFNRRAANGELGVRVQVSRGTSNPTMNKAINHLTIAKAVDEGYLDEDFFEDTDNPDELVKRVTIYHRVSIDYQSFTSKMLCTEGVVIDTHFKADKISTSKRRIICRTVEYARYI